MEVERIEIMRGARFDCGPVSGVMDRGASKGTISWDYMGVVKIQDARAFAQRIIAVADAVEQELAKGEK